MLLLLCDTLTFRQAYPTFRHGCRSNNSNNSDQKYQIKKKRKIQIIPRSKKKQNAKSQIPKFQIQNLKSAWYLLKIFQLLG